MERTLPEGACNAHCHVFGPRDRFPYPPGASFIPNTDAPKEALYALNDRFGLQRCVIVQSSCHGFDNSATEDAIATRPRDYRGIALLPVDVSDTELRRLDKAGFRGVRFNFMAHLGHATPVDAIVALAKRIAPLGWHLQVHGDPGIVPGVVETLLTLGPVPVVIDHIGRLDASLGLEQPYFTQFRRLLDNPRCWMKVSGIDRISKSGPPYDDAMPFARILVAQAGERVLWGNDWPHPNHAGPIPDETVLVRSIARLAPEPAQRQALLADNPARLYRFGDL